MKLACPSLIVSLFANYLFTSIIFVYTATPGSGVRRESSCYVSPPVVVTLGASMLNLALHLWTPYES